MEIKNGLGSLYDPLKMDFPIDTSGFKTETLHQLLEKMCNIRIAEEKIAWAKKNGMINGPVHLGVGQEAASVGVASNLIVSDRVFGAHRSHAQILALKMDLRALFAELLGKSTGFSKGMGGSMHLWHQPAGFYGSVPIVSGTVPLAVGAGLAAKFQKKSDVAVAFFGDGAIEEGVVHESLNLAKVLDIPVIFVVENNLFASHMHISRRQPNSSTARFAIANEIPCQIIDGNDVLAVARSAQKIIERVREGRGPEFLELVTYRWYGHVDWREDIDVGVHRSEEDLKNWKMLDPILRLKRAMIDKKILSEKSFESMRKTLKEEANSAWNYASSDGYPDTDMTLSSVYKVDF